MLNQSTNEQSEDSHRRESTTLMKETKPKTLTNKPQWGRTTKSSQLMCNVQDQKRSWNEKNCRR